MSAGFVNRPDRNQGIDNNRLNNYSEVMSGRLSDDIKQTKPFRSLEEEVLLNMWRTTDALQREVAELLRTADLSPTQYNVLRILRGAGSDGLKCREIGDRMVTRDPDITRLLDRMEKRGLIERRRDSRDRRVVETKITASGLRVLKSLDEPVVELTRRQLAHMDQKSLEALNALLERARESAR